MLTKTDELPPRPECFLALYTDHTARTLLSRMAERAKTFTKAQGLLFRYVGPEYFEIDNAEQLARTVFFWSAPFHCKPFRFAGPFPLPRSLYGMGARPRYFVPISYTLAENEARLMRAAAFLLRAFVTDFEKRAVRNDLPSEFGDHSAVILSENRGSSYNPNWQPCRTIRNEGFEG